MINLHVIIWGLGVQKGLTSKTGYTPLIISLLIDLFSSSSIIEVKTDSSEELGWWTESWAQASSEGPGMSQGLENWDEHQSLGSGCDFFQFCFHSHTHAQSLSIFFPLILFLLNRHFPSVAVLGKLQYLPLTV